MKKLPDISLVNGKLESSVPVTDRGLHYGDGLFETILCLDQQLILRAPHLARLWRDAVRLKITIDITALEKELAQLQAMMAALGKDAGVVKIIVTRESSGRGYSTGGCGGSNRLLQFTSGIQYPKANRDGIRMALSDLKLAQQPALAGIKHLNRLEQVLAHSAIPKPFYQEALLCDSQQRVIEGTISNVFFVKDGKLVTPGLDQAGVRGVMRDHIMDAIAPPLKIMTSEARVTLADVLAADEVFVCNSVFGVWPVQALHVREYAIGTVTRRVQHAVDALGFPSVHA